MKNRETVHEAFERVFVSLAAIATGVMLIYLAVAGPLFLNHIRYMTAAVINNQIVGQDLVNLFLLGPLAIAGGITLILRRQIAKYLLIMTPLYLIYYVLSYTIGWEWSSGSYRGNSEHYTFSFLFMLIAALIVMAGFVYILRGCRTREGGTAALP